MSSKKKSVFTKNLSMISQFCPKIMLILKKSFHLNSRFFFPFKFHVQKTQILTSLNTKIFCDTPGNLSLHTGWKQGWGATVEEH